jgi:hypothetical protein
LRFSSCDRAASRRDDRGAARHSFAQSFGLDLSEPFFSFALDQLGDRAADFGLDHAVEIYETAVEPCGQHGADGRLAGGHESKEKNGGMGG